MSGFIFVLIGKKSKDIAGTRHFKSTRRIMQDQRGLNFVPFVFRIGTGTTIFSPGAVLAG
jgi:hypothetical protein